MMRSSGHLAQSSIGMAPRRLVVEVTTAVHNNEVIWFGVYSTNEADPLGSRASRAIPRREGLSRSHTVHADDEIQTDLAAQMAGCITSKAVKRYPFGTALILGMHHEHPDTRRGMARCRRTRSPNADSSSV